MPSDPRDNLSPPQRLMAFADGELDAARQLEAMRLVAVDPAGARAVEHEIRLRQAVSRAVAHDAGPSETLTRSVAAMAFQMPATEATPSSSSAIRRWMPMGIAAAIALLASGVVIGRFALDRPGTVVAIGPAPLPVTPAADVLPAAYITSATQVHVRCSRGVEHHTHTEWPKPLASIEGPVKRYARNNDQIYPDLSSIGFNYLGCGPCGRPQQQGVHLLYRSTTGTDTLSLFIEPFKNQVDLAPDSCRYCKTSDIHPVLVWRTADLVFFMVGNARTPVEKARIALKLADPS